MNKPQKIPLMPTSRHQIYPQEYDVRIKSPLDSKLYSIVTGQPVLVPGAPVVSPGDGCGSGCLHHDAYIETQGNVWVSGDNLCNISGLGIPGSTIPMTQTKVTGARQVIAYANAGDPGGLGYGVVILTTSGKLILLGNTQSGFRGDGTEGLQAEPTPYPVTSISGTIAQIAAGLFLYARTTDGKVYGWGGTRQTTPAPYMLAQGVNLPMLLRPTLMAFPEPIVDIQGGSNILLAIGQSGKIYGCAMNARYLGLGSSGQPSTKPIDITAALGLPGTPVQLAVGPQACYALMPNGDAYAWGDNTQAAIGNGQEANLAALNYVAPWSGGLLWQDKPIKINPPGVSFVKIFTSLGDAFYVYYEDTNGNLWNNGRNKGYVLWNGQGGTPDQQSAQPNLWDVLKVSKITGFGPISPVQPTPVPTPVPTPATPRKVNDIKATVFGTVIDIPLTSAKITYDDGSTQ